MNTQLRLSLAPPSPATRQVGISLLGSPLELTRSISGRSDSSTPEESLHHRLRIFKTYLEHEIEFLDGEIRALVERPITADTTENAAFLELRNGLKIRYNTLQTRLNRLNALLEVM